MLTQTEITEQLKGMQDAYIHIDTAFVRKGKPMHQLYKQNYKRRIYIPKESLVSIRLKQTLDMVQEIIKKHYIKNKGNLGIFGDIRFYYYKHCDGNIYGYDKHGERL